MPAVSYGVVRDKAGAPSRQPPSRRICAGGQTSPRMTDAEKKRPGGYVLLSNL